MNELPGQSILPSLAAYELEPPVTLFPLWQGVNNHTIGVHTARGDYVAKIYRGYDDSASIAYEHALLNWVGSAGPSFRVPVPVPTREGRQLSHSPHGWLSLTPLVPGMCPEFRLVDGRRDARASEHAELMGAALGELQVVLRQYPILSRPGRSLFGALFEFPPPERDPLTLSPERLGLVDAESHRELFSWWRAEATDVQAFVAGPYRDLPWQVCHNDVAPANVLIDHGRVSAILDFEFATLTPRALDVAMGLRMVMQAWENPEPWELARRFCQGYSRWTLLNAAEVQALPMLMRLRTAIPLLWWLGRRGTRDELERVPTHLARVRFVTLWLDQHGQRLVDLVMREAC